MMEILLLTAVGIIGAMEIYNYIKTRNLEKRTERTFIEVEKNFNVLERKIRTWK